MPPELDRRAALTALFAGATLAIPAVAATSATAHLVLAESPELLALGAQIEARSAVTHFAPGDWEYRLFIERLG